MYCLENRQTLLWHLLCEGYEPQHYLENLENIEIAINYKEYFKSRLYWRRLGIKNLK